MVRESLVSNCFSGPLGRSLFLTSHHALQCLWLLSWWYVPTAGASGHSESRSLSFCTAGDFELPESVHVRESWVHFIQNGWLSGFIVIKGLRVFCFWLQTHSAYEESVYCCSQGCSMSVLWDGWGLLNVPLWIRWEPCWRTRGETMQFCCCFRRSPLSHNSDVLVTSARLRTRVQKNWNRAELRYFLTGKETDVGLMDPLEMPSYLFIYFRVY